MKSHGIFDAKPSVIFKENLTCIFPLRRRAPHRAGQICGQIELLSLQPRLRPAERRPPLRLCKGPSAPQKKADCTVRPPVCLFSAEKGRTGRFRRLGRGPKHGDEQPHGGAAHGSTGEGTERTAGVHAMAGQGQKRPGGRKKAAGAGAGVKRYPHRGAGVVKTPSESRGLKRGFRALRPSGPGNRRNRGARRGASG